MSQPSPARPAVAPDRLVQGGAASPIGAFLLCVGLYFSGVTLNTVLVPWMVIQLLKLDAAKLGMAQAMLTLPMALLVLVGGAMADRFDRRRLLIACHVLASVPPLLLGVAQLSGHLSYGALVATLAGIGVAAAALNPTRDALLMRVAGPKMQSVVSATVMIQFAVQIGVFTLSASLKWLEVGYLLLLQGSLWLAGAFVALRLPSDPPARAAAAVGGAVSIAWGRLWPPIIMTGLLAIFSTGGYVVLLPLLVLKGLGLGAIGLAGANLAFCLGAVAMSVTLMRRGGFKSRHGLWLLIAVIGAMACLSLLSLPLRIEVMCVVLFVYGGAAAVSTMLLRTFIQARADPRARGRALSFYNLAFIGGGAMGAAVLGLIAARTSPGDAALAAAAGLAVALAAIGAGSRLFREAL